LISIIATMRIRTKLWLILKLKYHVKTVFEVEHRNLAVLTANKATIRIGRADDNDVIFDSPHVSRYHAILQRVGMPPACVSLATPRARSWNNRWPGPSPSWGYRDRQVLVYGTSAVGSASDPASASSVAGLRYDPDRTGDASQ
jgi:hypothetical protein